MNVQIECLLDFFFTLYTEIIIIIIFNVVWYIEYDENCVLKDIVSILNKIFSIKNFEWS